MRIVICDDNKYFLEEFRHTLRKVANTDDICTCTTANEVFQFFESDKKVDILFLDLALEGEDTGIQVAEKLQQHSPETQIIYVTGYTDQFVQDIFLHKGNISGFLTKPINETMLLANLKKAEQTINTAKNKLVLRTRSGLQSIIAEDILYMESQGHLLILYTVNSTSYHVYEKLSEILNLLPTSFVQCHKSFAVNLQHIQRFNTKEIMLKNGTSIPVSRSKLQLAKDAYFSFIGYRI